MPRLLGLNIANRFCSVESQSVSAPPSLLEAPILDILEKGNDSRPRTDFFYPCCAAYSNGYGLHGEIDLKPERFEHSLSLIIDKHLDSNGPVATRLIASRLFAPTIYTLRWPAPSQRSWRWKRFVIAYQRFINDVARFVSPSDDVARELAENLLSDLFLPDGSGRSRLASFDGRQSLATWLRVVISRRAINHGLLKWNGFERGDRLADVADKASIGRIEAAIRSNRYEAILQECLKLASESLTDRERLMLLMRYDEGLRLVEIARLLAVHPSCITREFQHLHLKLQKRIVSFLAVKYHLGPEAIKECVRDVIENPAHSLLVFLEAS